MDTQIRVPALDRRHRLSRAVLCGALSVTMAAACSTPSTSSSPATSAPSGSTPGTVFQAGGAERSARDKTIGQLAAALPVPTASQGRGSFAWQTCGKALCSSLQVPYDYTSPGATFSLAVEMVPASDPARRIGILLWNPGGPGEAAVGRTAAVAMRFPEAVRARFDIVGFDPRGIGASTPLVCQTLGEILDLKTTDVAAAEIGQSAGEKFDAEVTAARTAGSACQAKSPAMFGSMGAANVARDMDRIREAFGETTLNYVGFSYGTALGQEYAAQFPERIRTMILDSVVDTALDWTAHWTGMAQGRELTLRTLLRECAKDPTCAFNASGQSEARFDTLFARLGQEPMLLANGTDYTQDALLNELNAVLYTGRTGFTPMLKLLAALDAGDTAAVQAHVDAAFANVPTLPAVPDDMTDEDFYELLFRYKDTPIDLGFALATINCLDRPTTDDRAAFLRADAAAAASAPVFGRFMVEAHIPCFAYPGIGTGFHQPGPSTPPVLVLNPTGDPATPLVNAQSVAKRLPKASLITVDSNRHIVIPGGIPCVDDAVTQYLVEAVLPPSATCGIPANGG